jgi:hypothetical protein
MRLVDFYAADERRAGSGEHCFGDVWFASEGEPMWSLRWLEATGELVALSGGFDERAELLAAGIALSELELMLTGWEAVCGFPHSLGWVWDRVWATGTPRPEHGYLLEPIGDAWLLTSFRGSHGRAIDTLLPSAERGREGALVAAHRLAGSILNDRLGFDPPVTVALELARDVISPAVRSDVLAFSAEEVDSWIEEYYPRVAQLTDRCDELRDRAALLESDLAAIRGDLAATERELHATRPIARKGFGDLFWFAARPHR